MRGMEYTKMRLRCAGFPLAPSDLIFTHIFLAGQRGYGKTPENIGEIGEASAAESNPGAKSTGNGGRPQNTAPSNSLMFPGQNPLPTLPDCTSIGRCPRKASLS